MVSIHSFNENKKQKNKNKTKQNNNNNKTTKQQTNKQTTTTEKHNKSGTYQSDGRVEDTTGHVLAFCAFNRGNMEGTNSSRMCVRCLDMYALFDICGET